MLFLQFECMPAPDSIAGEAFTEAVINCWIEGLEPVEAEEYARSVIGRQGWKVGELKEIYTITRAEYEDGHSQEGLEAFDEATKTGQCFICHTFLAEPKLN